MTSTLSRAAKHFILPLQLLDCPFHGASAWRQHPSSLLPTFCLRTFVPMEMRRACSRYLWTGCRGGCASCIWMRETTKARLQCCFAASRAFLTFHSSSCSSASCLQGAFCICLLCMRCVVPFFFGVDSLSSMRRFFFTMQGRLFYQKPYNETAPGAMNIYRPGASAAAAACLCPQLNKPNEFLRATDAAISLCRQLRALPRGLCLGRADCLFPWLVRVPEGRAVSQRHLRQVPGHPAKMRVRRVQGCHSDCHERHAMCSMQGMPGGHVPSIWSLQWRAGI